jgi:hypothetical protein
MYADLHVMEGKMNHRAAAAAAVLFQLQDFDLVAMYADLHAMESKLKQLLAEMAADKPAAAAAGDTQRVEADEAVEGGFDQV